MNIFEFIAEQKIKAGIEEGLFENLPGEGKPLELEDLSGISPEDRMVYTILKNAGVLPPEMEARKVISDLEKQMNEINSEDERTKVRKKIDKMKMAYEIMMDKRRKK